MTTLTEAAQVESILANSDEPFNYRNIRLSSIEAAYEFSGRPETIPAFEPGAAHDALRSFAAALVDRIGLGIIMRVVVVHDQHYWREVMRVTVFHDIVANEYVVQLFDSQVLVAILRFGRESVRMPVTPSAGTGRFVVLLGFLAGVMRYVPLVATGSGQGVLGDGVGQSGLTAGEPD